MYIRSIIKELEIIFSNYKFYNSDDLKNNVLNYIKFKLNGLSLEESLELLSKISKSTNYSIENIYWLDDEWVNENKIELLSFINPVNYKEVNKVKKNDDITEFEIKFKKIYSDFFELIKKHNKIVGDSLNVDTNSRYFSRLALSYMSFKWYILGMYCKINGIGVFNRYLEVFSACFPNSVKEFADLRVEFLKLIDEYNAKYVKYYEIPEEMYKSDHFLETDEPIRKRNILFWKKYKQLES